MQVRSSIKKRCEDCQLIIRKGIKRINCTKKVRHKQRQG